MIRGQAACAPLDLLQSVARSNRVHSWISVFPLATLIALTLSVACGDDSGGSKSGATDAGTKNGSMDGGLKNGGMTMIPRRDAQVSNEPDPITPCSRANANACGSDEVCDLLVRRAPTDTSFKYYTGCVKATPERAEGDPCDPDITAGVQYEAEGLKDIVFRDPCGAGLVCSPNRKIRGAYSCQTACSTGQLDPNQLACKDPTTLCVQGTQISEFCRKADGCNVEKQTGCQSGENCYILPSDDNKQILSVCSPRSKSKPTEDNAPGCSPASCKAGSVCFGPVHVPIAAWKNENVMCRPACNGQMGTAPADEDGGVPSGLCSATARCQPYSESGLVLSSIPTPPFGQCESQ